MKTNKLLAIILTALIILTGCNKNVYYDQEKYNFDDLSIITPTGAPSLAFLNEMDNENFESNAVPINIISMMQEGSKKEIVVIDTVSGIKAIKLGAPYKLAAVITFGNFYIASTGNDDNGVMDKGDKIVLFNKGNTPDLVFHYLYGDAFDETIEYVSAVSDAGKCLALGKNLETGSDIDYVFIAEPVLTNILNNKETKTYGKAQVYQNVQELYHNKTGYDMILASVFIKNDSDNTNGYLEYLKENIDKTLNEEGYVSNLLEGRSDEEVSSLYGIGTKVISQALKTNSIGLGFKKAIDVKLAIDTYIGLFNLEKTNEEIYYK